MRHAACGMPHAAYGPPNGHGSGTEKGVRFGFDSGFRSGFRFGFRFGFHFGFRSGFRSRTRAGARAPKPEESLPSALYNNIQVGRAEFEKASKIREGA